MAIGKEIEGIEEVTTQAVTFKVYKIRYQQTNVSLRKEWLSSFLICTTSPPPFSNREEWF
jgi:hypothetical protein